ncbi:MAG: SDR family oxidoreductase [Chloroflexota bacterium]
MILVVGASGMLGGMIAHQLLAQGKQVRVLLRHNSPAMAMAAQGMATNPQSLLDAGAEAVYGDLKDRASLDAACAGVETVITTANAALRGGEDTFETVDRQGTQHLIDAARAQGVQQFIYMSANGSDPQHPHPLFSAKGACEAYLQESGLTYTILKPGVFMEVWIGTVIGMPLQAQQPITLIGEGKTKHAFVSMGDVAAYAVTAVHNPDAFNQTIYIGGPASYSWIEVVKAVETAVGLPLPVNFVAPGAPVPLLPPDMIPMMVGLEMADAYIGMEQTAALYKITPTPLAAFAQRFFGNGHTG